MVRSKLEAHNKKIVFFVDTIEYNNHNNNLASGLNKFKRDLSRLGN